MPDEGAERKPLSVALLLLIGLCFVAGVLIVYFGERMEYDTVSLLALAVVVFVAGLLLIFRGFVWDSLRG